MWEISASSSEFCCESKLTLKKKVYLKRKKHKNKFDEPPVYRLFSKLRIIRESPRSVETFREKENQWWNPQTTGREVNTESREAEAIRLAGKTAAAAAQSIQLCLTVCDLIDQILVGSIPSVEFPQQEYWTASSMHETGHSKPVRWDNPEGWDGEEGGKGVQDGGHMYTHGWFMSMCGKYHHNIVK